MTETTQHAHITLARVPLLIRNPTSFLRLLLTDQPLLGLPTETWTPLVAQMVKRLPTMWGTGFNPWVGKIPWRRKWRPTPVFLPGKSHGRRSLVGYSPWGHKESDTTERLHFTSPKPKKRNLLLSLQRMENPKVMLTAGDENSKLLWLRCQLMGHTQRRLRDSYCILELY